MLVLDRLSQLMLSILKGGMLCRGKRLRNRYLKGITIIRHVRCSLIHLNCNIKNLRSISLQDLRKLSPMIRHALFKKTIVPLI